MGPARRGRDRQGAAGKGMARLGFAWQGSCRIKTPAGFLTEIL